MQELANACSVISWGVRAGGCAPQHSLGPVHLPLRRVEDNQIRALPKQQPCAWHQSHLHAAKEARPGMQQDVIRECSLLQDGWLLTLLPKPGIGVVAIHHKEDHGLQGEDSLRHLALLQYCSIAANHQNSEFDIRWCLRLARMQ